MHCKYWIAILCFCGITFSSAVVSQTQPIVCTQQYALCTSAPCIPDPRHAGYAICDCVVKQGQSAGYKTCAERAPINKKLKIRQIISTFSFAQFAAKKFLSCPKGSPWTNCVDAPCVIDLRHPERAICSCPVDDTQAFATLGGDCNVATCKTGFWSGATQSAAKELRAELSTKTKITLKQAEGSNCAVVH